MSLVVSFNTTGTHYLFIYSYKQNYIIRDDIITSYFYIRLSNYNSINICITSSNITITYDI